MKDRKELKLLISAMVVIGTIFSLGCISAADENDEEDMIPDQTVNEIIDEDIVICEVNEVVAAEADNMISDGWFQDPSNGWWGRLLLRWACRSGFCLPHGQRRWDRCGADSNQAAVPGSGGSFRLWSSLLRGALRSVLWCRRSKRFCRA